MWSSSTLSLRSPRGKNAGRGQAIVNIYVKQMLRMPSNARRDQLAMLVQNGLPGFAMLALLKFRALKRERRAMRHPESFARRTSSWADAGFEGLAEEEAELVQLEAARTLSMSESSSSDEDSLERKSKRALKFAGETDQASRIREAKRDKFRAKQKEQASKIPKSLRMTPISPPRRSPPSYAPRPGEHEIVIEGQLDPMADTMGMMQKMINAARESTVQFRARQQARVSIKDVRNETAGEEDAEASDATETADLPKPVEVIERYANSSTDAVASVAGTALIDNLYEARTTLQRHREQSGVKPTTVDVSASIPLQPRSRQAVAMQPQETGDPSTAVQQAKKDSLVRSSLSFPSKRSENSSPAPRPSPEPRSGRKTFSPRSNYHLAVPLRWSSYSTVGSRNANTLRDDELFPNLYRAATSASPALGLKVSQSESIKTVAPESRKPPTVVLPRPASSTETHDFAPGAYNPTAGSVGSGTLNADPLIVAPAQSPRSRKDRGSSDTDSAVSSSSSQARRALAYKLNDKKKLWSPTASKSTASVGMGSPTLTKFWGAEQGQNAEDATRKASVSAEAVEKRRARAKSGKGSESEGRSEMVEVGGGNSLVSWRSKVEKGLKVKGQGHEQEETWLENIGKTSHSRGELRKDMAPSEAAQASTPADLTSSTSTPSEPVPTDSPATASTTAASLPTRRRARSNAVSLRPEEESAELLSESESFPDLATPERQQTQ